jgi:hypothetical protein
MNVAVKEQRFVEVDGEITRICRRTVEREVKTTEFSRELAGLVPVDSGFLPAACVHFIRGNVDGRPSAVFTIERPAALTPVKYKQFYDPAGNALPAHVMHDLVLAWPNTLWLFHTTSDNVSNLYITATKQPIGVAGYKTELFALPMVNLYEACHGHTCFGNNLKLDKALPMHRRINLVVEHMLTSMWNDELRPAWPRCGIPSLKAWHDATAADPLYAGKIVYEQHKRRTYGEFVTALLKLAEVPQ